MTVIRAAEQPLTLENKPAWCQIPRAGFFRMPREGGEHDLHHHDANELYLVTAGKAKILVAGREHYVRAGDIVCIEAGDDHDILEIYDDEDFSLFWLYEPGAEHFGHLRRTPESGRPHPVPAKPLPADFPD